MSNGQATMDQSSTGMPNGVCVLLSYLFGWLGGVVFLAIEKDSKIVRFSAMQSILLNAAVFIAMIVVLIIARIPGLFSILSMVNGLVGLGYLVLIILLIVAGFQNKKIKLPIIGPLAERLYTFNF